VPPNTEKSESNMGVRDKEATPGSPRLAVFHKEHKKFKTEDYATRAETFSEVVDTIGVGEPMIDSFATPSNMLGRNCGTFKVMHDLNYGQGKDYSG